MNPHLSLMRLVGITVPDGYPPDLRLARLRRRYPTEAARRLRLEELRWPQGLTARTPAAMHSRSPTV